MHTGPISLCVNFVFICVYVDRVFLFHTAYFCRIIVSAVGWTWLDWSLLLRTYPPSVLWHCWLGHLTRKKPLPDMTYNVFGGTLNLTLSICLSEILTLWQFRQKAELSRRWSSSICTNMSSESLRKVDVIKFRWRLLVECLGNTAARQMMLTLVTVVARHCSVTGY